MYKDVGPPFRNLKKKNEWCEFDYEKGRRYALYFKLYMAIIFIFGFIGIVYVLRDDISGFTYFSYILLIIIIILGLLIIVILKKMDKTYNRVISEYQDSLCVRLDPKNIDLNNLLSSIDFHLIQFGIEYETSDFGPKDNYIFLYHRKDNLNNFLAISNKKKSGISICIFPNDFDRKEYAKRLKDLIWDESPYLS